MVGRADHSLRAPCRRKQPSVPSLAGPHVNFNENLSQPSNVFHDSLRGDAKCKCAEISCASLLRVGNCCFLSQPSLLDGRNVFCSDSRLQGAPLAIYRNARIADLCLQTNQPGTHATGGRSKSTACRVEEAYVRPWPPKLGRFLLWFCDLDLLSTVRHKDCEIPGMLRFLL